MGEDKTVFINILLLNNFTLLMIIRCLCAGPNASVLVREIGVFGAQKRLIAAFIFILNSSLWP